VKSLKVIFFFVLFYIYARRYLGDADSLLIGKKRQRVFIFRIRYLLNMIFLVSIQALRVCIRRM